MITYDDLAAALEDAWLVAGLHDHDVVESVNPEALERTYRAELFPEHPEPMPEHAMPPWVEVALTWTAAHQLRSEGHSIAPGVLELQWTYSVDVRSEIERTDYELLRAFQGAVRVALRRVAPETVPPAEYVAIEVRRGYRHSNDRMVPAYVQLIGANRTDLSDLWDVRSNDAVRDALREELLVVAALVHTLGEAFAPASLGNYRAVDTA